jgi:hypothetical protein
LVLASSYLESLGTREKTLNMSEPEKTEGDTVPGLAAASTMHQPINIDNRGGKDLTIYKYYIDTVGWVTWWVFVLLCSGFVFGLVFPRSYCPLTCCAVMNQLTLIEEIWIQFWTEANAKQANYRLAYYLSLYALWPSMAIVLFLGACSYVLP